MSEPASISQGIAERYATALFDLAKDEGRFDALETDIDTLDAAWRESADLRTMALSPLYSRDAQKGAVGTLAEAMELSALTANTLRLMAAKRRLFVLPHFVQQARALIAEEKGETTAEVTAAAALSEAQAERLAAMLREKLGEDVKLKTAVDESLIGGLVVKVGSRMIDTSVAARLANLQNAMKEVR